MNNNPDLSKIKCVIVDFDGTLYSDAYWDDCDTETFEFLVENGYYTGTFEQFMEENNFPSHYHFTQCTCEYLKKLGRGFEHYIEYEKNRVYDFLTEKIRRVNPKLVKKVSKKYKLYMLSDSFQKYLEFYIKNFKMKKKWFKAIVSNDFKADDMSKTPFMIQILKDAEVLPEEAVMVGDSKLHDIVPAKALGIQTKWVRDVKDTDKFLAELADFKV